MRMRELRVARARSSLRSHDPGVATAAVILAPIGWPAVAGATAIGPVSPVPVASEFSASPNSDPLGITASPDGNLWYIEQDWKVGRITPTGAITDFSSGIDHEGSAAPFGDLQQIAARPATFGRRSSMAWSTGSRPKASCQRVRRNHPAQRSLEGITPGCQPLVH